MASNHKSKTKYLLWLALYTGFIFIFMFAIREPQYPRRINLNLFYTVRHYLAMWKLNSIGYKANAAINLAGNIVFFVPLGLLLPLIWKLQRHLPVLIITGALIISCLEALQYATARGCADIDDLLLNLIGVLFGYILYKVMLRHSQAG